jgi:exopolysaccharide biosynthesis protein
MLVSALVVLIATACATQAPQHTGPRPDSSRVVRLAKDAVYEYRWYASGPWAVHTVMVRPSQCKMGFRTIKGLSRRIGREQTSALARRASDSLSVIAAINGDFFSFDPAGVSEGPQISNSIVLKSEGHHREALEDRRLRLQSVFAVDREGRPVVLHTRMRGSVQARDLSIPLAGVNVPPRSDSAFVYTPFWGEATPTDSTAWELVLRERVIARIDSAAAGVDIPPHGAVIALRGSARAQAGTLRVGDTLRWQADFTGVPAAREMIGGYPMLLLKGKPVYQEEAGLRAPFADRRHPRAAIGVDRRGHVFIVAVDGRQPSYSDGMTLQEFSRFLTAYGITDALNLDGGGSTTLIVEGRIANRPSDSNGERAVSNALLVIDQSRAGACTGKR